MRAAIVLSFGTVTGFFGEDWGGGVHGPAPNLHFVAVSAFSAFYDGSCSGKFMAQCERNAD